MTREEAINAITAFVENYANGNDLVGLRTAIEALKEERPHGEWIKTDNRWGLGEYECSACRSYLDIPTQMGEPMFKWCPYCGARMKEGEAE